MKLAAAKIEPLKPPTGLCAAAREFFAAVVADFRLENHHAKLLTEASWQLHRAEQAREQIAKDGPIVQDRFGQDKAHPSLAIERNASLAYLRLRRELCLDIEPNEVRTPRRSAGRR